MFSGHANIRILPHRDFRRLMVPDFARTVRFRRRMPESEKLAVTGTGFMGRYRERLRSSIGKRLHDKYITKYILSTSSWISRTNYTAYAGVSLSDLHLIGCYKTHFTKSEFFRRRGTVRFEKR